MYTGTWGDSYQEANKRHWCDRCGEPIEKGEDYMKARGVWDGKMQVWKFCEACCDLPRFNKPIFLEAK